MNIPGHLLSDEGFIESKEPPLGPVLGVSVRLDLGGLCLGYPVPAFLGEEVSCASLPSLRQREEKLGLSSVPREKMMWGPLSQTFPKR